MLLDSNADPHCDEANVRAIEAMDKIKICEGVKIINSGIEIQAQDLKIIRILLLIKSLALAFYGLFRPIVSQQFL